MLSRDISKARRVVFPSLSPGIPYLTDEDLCLPWRTVPGELFGLVSMANSSVVLPKMFSRPPGICASVLLTLALAIADGYLEEATLVELPILVLCPFKRALFQFLLEIVGETGIGGILREIKHDALKKHRSSRAKSGVA
ncbi:hypothetical protein EAG_06439 [Camponotus floridanus]|uniref:Uncharacterized protein n=1 Tax=Camponotus floridanus TaxID=104421 RepID=E1ZY98_CAMFO|nr:hypothetical protein EAG_06439 [Camponotus floridanus]